MKQRRDGIILSYVNIVLSTVLGLFMSSFIIGKLGQSQYGIYQIMSSFANYLTLLQFGTGTVMTRNIAKCIVKDNNKESINRTISTVFTITIFLTVIVIVVSAIFYFSIDAVYTNSLSVEERTYGKRLFIFLTAYLIFNFLTQTFNGVAFGFEDFSTIKKIGILKLLLRTVVIVAVFQINASSMGIVIVDALLDFLILVYTIAYCRTKYRIVISLRLFSKVVFSESMPLATALFLQTFVNQANSNVDKFVIGVMLTPEKVAIYSVAMYIYSTYSSLSTIPITIYLPKVVKDVNTGLKGKELASTLIQPCRLLVAIGGGVLFGFITIGKPFITILYGIDYLEAYKICIIIMIPMFINLSNGILVNVLDALGKRMSRSIILTVTTLLNIVLTVWWIQNHGIVGAAIATAVATTLGQIICMNLYYEKALGIPVLYMLKNTYKGIIPSFLIASFIGMLSFKMSTIALVQFFVGGIVFCGVFIILMVFWGATNAEKQVLVSISKKIRGK